MVKLKPFDAAKHFPTAEAQNRLIADAKATGNPCYSAKVDAIVKRARTR
ncbi:hypothetical protein [Sphingobium sp.]|jgi:hypothetical protein|nr:hypothetical protein [Sphingobium sp.]